MPRKPRTHFTGAIYHVMLRGNNRERIFFDNDDREYFLSVLKDSVQQFEHRIHAYCLMTNHIHLAIQAGSTPLSKVMQSISLRYTYWINKRFQRVGHVFQGRYHAILVNAENYLLQLIRYIHLNPVRANLVKSADDYFWSSHCAYMGYSKISWLTTNVSLGYFSDNLSIARDQYVKFIHKYQENSKDSLFLTGNQKGFSVLSDEVFLKTMQQEPETNMKILISLDELVSAVCMFYDVSMTSLNDALHKKSNAKIRAMITWLAQDLRISTLTGTAAYLKRDATAIARTIRRMQNKPAERYEFETIKNNLLKRQGVLAQNEQA